MKCPLCKKGNMVDGVTGFTKELDGGGELVIENVPCIKCDKCGESLLSEPIVYKLKDLRDFYTKFSGQVFVVDFQRADFGKS